MMLGKPAQELQEPEDVVTLNKLVFREVKPWHGCLLACRMLIGAMARGTEAFRDARGCVQSVIAVLMADGWTDCEKRLFACQQVMLRQEIYPALPDVKGGYAFGDACHPWPTPEPLKPKPA